MIDLKGEYNNALIFTDFVESSAQDQIIQLCDQEISRDSIIRVMPDVHAGKGCVIGMTMLLPSNGIRVIPNMVGSDINCGVFVAKIEERVIDMDKLSQVIHKYIPSGIDVRETVHRFCQYISLEDLCCKKHINLGRALLSIGTLGSGNHFIEVDRDEEGKLYIIIHTGSRYLGKQVCEYYQNIAHTQLRRGVQQKEIIQTLKAASKKHLIQGEIEKAKKEQSKVPKELAYLDESSTQEYLKDMKIIESYATQNRFAIFCEISKYMNFNIDYSFTTIHNYIDIQHNILRKGAVSAQKGEKLIIPINMRDGSLLCEGKGNSEWNYSAPHGAGRLLPRGKAKQLLSLSKYKEEMEMRGIYTTSVNEQTLDECGDAYKPIEDIIQHIGDTVEVKKRLYPIYNFKR